MSATAQASPAVESDKSRWYVHVFFLALFVTWTPLLVALIVSNFDRIRAELPDLLLWSLATLLVNLLPLSGWTSAPFVADLPIITAVALIFRPPEAALIAFLGGVDRPSGPRNSISKSLWNHSQVSLSLYAGSALAHLFPPISSHMRLLVPAAFAGLLGNYASNYLMVGLSMKVRFDEPLMTAMSNLLIGTGPDFVLAFVAGGSAGALVAGVYEHAGLWILPAVLGIVVSTRQAILRSQMYAARDRDYKSREKALTEMAQQVNRERADERRLIAADLHDEVLPVLLHVSLMSQVICKNLELGHLEQVETDLPAVASAASTAADQLRSILGDLRRPGLGRKGITSVLRRLASLNAHDPGITIELNLEEVAGTPSSQLALYQIAKEAIANALTHANASVVRVELSETSGQIRLVVSDDGKGFDPLVFRPLHYGLDIMRERAAAVGGDLRIHSARGLGTSITVSVPIIDDEGN